MIIFGADKAFFIQQLLLLGSFVVVVCFLLSRLRDISRPALPLTPSLIRRQEKRVAESRLNELISTLGIKEGMVIIDVGAGSGQYTYPFARALKGTGKVIAADVNAQMVRYVQEQSRAMGLDNIEAVQVAAQGVDVFYARQKCDLIFLAHADSYIPDFKDYVRKMKNCLMPRGRFALLRRKEVDPFTADDITDMQGLLQEVVQEEKGSPFYQYFAGIRTLAQESLTAGNASQALERKLLGILNGIVFEDMGFYAGFLVTGENRGKEDFLKQELDLTPDERYAATHMFGLLNEGGLLDERGVLLPKARQSDYYFLTQFTLARLNQTLIIQRFRPYLYGGRSPYLPGGPYVSKPRKIEADFIGAGYALLGRYDFIPYDLLMVFSI